MVYLFEDDTCLTLYIYGNSSSTQPL